VEAGSAGAAREALWADVEGLRVCGRAQWEQMSRPKDDPVAQRLVLC
jgi:hypothetical protein